MVGASLNCHCPALYIIHSSYEMVTVGGFQDKTTHFLPDAPLHVSEFLKVSWDGFMPRRRLYQFQLFLQERKAGCRLGHFGESLQTSSKYILAGVCTDIKNAVNLYIFTEG